MARKLVVEIIGDASSLERNFGRARKSTSQFGRDLEHQNKAVSRFTVGLKRLAVAAGGVFAGEKVLEFGKDAVESAAQVQKAQEAVTAEYGKSSAAVLDFGEKAAASLGISAKASAQSAAQFGILFKGLGIGHGQAAQMTIGLQQLAGALSAIKGTDPSKSLDSLRLALAGNTRGLKAFGIVADAASIKQEALRLGLIKHIHDAITPGIKAQAIYAIATRHLGEFQQQAAAHAGDLTNQQRKLSAEWSNAKDRIGAELLPVVTKLATFMAENLPGALDATGRAFRAVQVRLAPVVAALRRNWPEISAAITTMARIAKAQFEAILPFIRAVAQVLKGVVEVISGLLHGDWSKVWQGLKDVVVGVFKELFALMRLQVHVWLAVGKAIGHALVRGIVAALRGLGRLVAALIKAPINAVIDSINAIKLPAFKVNTHIPGVGKISSPKLDPIPHIPRLATGGIVTRPTLALVGESGPEAVVPLGRGGGGVTIQGDIHLHGVANPRQFLDELQRIAKTNTGSTRGRSPGINLGLT